MKGIVPTGGRGTRMQPLTFSTNKHFIPVANKPLIFYPIESFIEAGIKDILINYNPGWLPLVKKHLGDGSKWGAKFTYILQEEPKGLANIVEVCEESLGGESFAFHLGDNIFTEGVRDIIEYFHKNKPNGLLYRVKHPENKRLGVPYFDKRNRLIRYVEKPTNPPHDFAVPGIYLADSNFFKSFRGKDKIKPSARGELEIPSPFQWLVDHGYRVDVIEYDGKWLDPGKFGDWIESNRYILDSKLENGFGSNPDKKSRVEGRVKIGKRCKIKNCEIRGPVSIADNVVLVDSYIGPYTSIDEGCLVEASHVENSVLMRGVKVSRIDKPINESLIGTDTEVAEERRPTDSISLFVGEKSTIKL